jgi:hypothetical protein
MLDREIKRELPLEWNGIIPTDIFMQEAEKTVEAASKKEVVLRVLGGTGDSYSLQGLQRFCG